MQEEVAVKIQGTSQRQLSAKSGRSNIHHDPNCLLNNIPVNNIHYQAITILVN
jgi:hypothetical protein